MQTQDARAFAVSRLDQPHQHHRHCVHNMSAEDQYAQRKRNGPGREWTDEEMQLLRLDQHIVTITSEDWEIDVPDLDYSRFLDS